MLTAIAIISVIAGLLIPAISAAKAKAKGVACKSNLHQFGFALTIYAADMEYFPTGSCIRYGYMWHRLLLPYASSNRAIFKCPAAPESLGWLTPGDGFLTRIRSFTYGYNSTGTANRPHRWLVRWKSSPLGLGWGNLALDNVSMEGMTRESEVLVPSDMIAIGDGNWEIHPWAEAVWRGWAEATNSKEQEAKL